MAQLFSNGQDFTPEDIANHLRDNGYTVVSQTATPTKLTVPGMVAGGPEQEVVRMVQTYEIKGADGKVSSWSFMQQPNKAFQLTGFKTSDEDAGLKAAKTAEEKAVLEEKIKKRNQEEQERAYYRGLGVGNFTHAEWQAHLARQSTIDRAALENKLAQATLDAKTKLADAQVAQAAAQTGLTQAQTTATNATAAATTTNAAANTARVEVERQSAIDRAAEAWAKGKAEEMVRRGTLTTANAEAWIKNQVELYKAVVQDNDKITDAAKTTLTAGEKARDQDITLRGQEIASSQDEAAKAFDLIGKLLPMAKQGGGNGVLAQTMDLLHKRNENFAANRPAAVAIPTALAQTANRPLTTPNPTAAFDLKTAYEHGAQTMAQQLGQPIYREDSPLRPANAAVASDAAVGQPTAPDPSVANGGVATVASPAAPTIPNPPPGAGTPSPQTAASAAASAQAAVAPAFSFQNSPSGGVTPAVTAPPIPQALTNVETDPVVAQMLMSQYGVT